MKTLWISGQGPDPVPLDIPLFIKDLLPNYISRRHEDAAQLADAFEKKDFEKIAKIAHTIKGNAETFGFRGLNNICREIEVCVRQNDTAKLKILIEKIKDQQNWI